MSDARRAAVHFSEVLARDPGNAEAQEGLASALFAYAHELRAAGSTEAAAAAFAQAAKFAPDNADAWIAFGNACMEAEVQRIEATRSAAPATGEDWLVHAIDAFSRAARLRPQNAEIAAKLAMAARYGCAWADAGRAIASIVATPQANCEPMAAVALLSDARMQRDVIAAWTRTHLRPPAAPAVVRRRGDRLRVGYLSTDFHEHATAHLAAGLFECHDGKRFETFAYAADRDDGSAMRARLRAAFSHWRDVRELGDAQAAELMRNDRLDVLVDLKGHTRGTRLPILGHRPAPVQLHYLGFPGTLAYEGVDGTIVDAIVAPERCRIRRAGAAACLSATRSTIIGARCRAASRRKDVGLPGNALVLACFNQTYKLTQPLARAWLDVVREHRDAVLWLNVPHALARHNLVAFAQQCGVDAARIVFAPMVDQAAHLARLQCADLALDVLPYGSHTTGSDALFAGVPLLTCRGTTFAGRVGASLCNAVGLTELICESPAEYGVRLSELCSRSRTLARLRQPPAKRPHDACRFSTRRLSHGTSSGCSKTLPSRQSRRAAPRD